MESSPVIVLFDEALDVPAQMPEIPIPVRVDLLSLQRLQKALAAGVVIRVRWPAHARNHVVVLKELHIRARGILAARMGWIHNPSRRLRPRDAMLQRRDRHPAGQLPARRPPPDL